PSHPALPDPVSLSLHVALPISSRPGCPHVHVVHARINFQRTHLDSIQNLPGEGVAKCDVIQSHEAQTPVVRSTVATHAGILVAPVLRCPVRHDEPVAGFIKRGACVVTEVHLMAMLPIYRKRECQIAELEFVGEVPAKLRRSVTDELPVFRIIYAIAVYIHVLELTGEESAVGIRFCFLFFLPDTVRSIVPDDIDGLTDEPAIGGV